MVPVWFFVGTQAVSDFFKFLSMHWISLFFLLGWPKRRRRKASLRRSLSTLAKKILIVSYPLLAVLRTNIVIYYLLQLNFHLHCTFYICGNISPYQPMRIVWLIIGISHQPNFSFLIFSSFQFFSQSDFNSNIIT